MNFFKSRASKIIPTSGSVHYMYVIQDIDNTAIENKTAKDLVFTLLNKCKGRSVKIAQKRPNGLRKLFFVTVLSERSIVETYNPDKAVNERYFD